MNLKNGPWLRVNTQGYYPHGAPKLIQATKCSVCSMCFFNKERSEGLGHLSFILGPCRYIYSKDLIRKSQNKQVPNVYKENHRTNRAQPSSTASGISPLGSMKTRCATSNSAGSLHFEVEESPESTVGDHKSHHQANWVRGKTSASEDVSLTTMSQL
jgi:hypothetical protein